MLRCCLRGTSDFLVAGRDTQELFNKQCIESQRVLGSTSLLARLLCLVSVSLSVALVDSVHENSE
jgi:hypothetical protein